MKKAKKAKQEKNQGFLGTLTGGYLAKIIETWREVYPKKNLAEFEITLFEFIQ